MLRSIKDSCEGSYDNPLSWAAAHRKFDQSAAPSASLGLRDQIAETTAHLRYRKEHHDEHD